METMNETQEYMNGYHFGFAYARGYGQKALFRAAISGRPAKTLDYHKGVVDAALALVTRES